MRNSRSRNNMLILLVFFGALLLPAVAFGAQVNLSIDTGGQERETISAALKVLGILTVLAIAPSILILTTSFTRVLIVLGFLKQALGTQNLPPSQVIIGLSLFLTMFIMAPTGMKMYERAVRPYMDGAITLEEATQRGKEPMRSFMLRQTREKDLILFYDIAKKAYPKKPSDIPFYILVPSFVLSELKTAFQMGFLIYLPFLIVDLIIASVLMAMGMVMLPPALISLPFKIMIFVVADGWTLVVGSLVRSFQ